MKRSIWLAIFMLTVMGSAASAQSRGSYFFENSLMRSKLNPAFAPKNDYASIIGIGNFNVDIASNVGLKNFIFPDGDVNYLFLNDAVPAEKFLSKMPKRDPYLQKRVETDLFGVGMKAGRDGYATLSLSLVENGKYVVSGDMLRYAKSSKSTDLRIFEGSSVCLAGYAALAAGYSHDLSAFVEGLRAGARIKLLLGLAAADIAIDKAGLQTGEDQISALLHGTGSLSGIRLTADNGFAIALPQFNSFGAAIDLGVSYRFPIDGPWLVEGLELSASVCDIGGLKYRHTLSSLLLDHQFNFTGIGDLTSDVSAKLEQTVNDLKAFTDIDPSEGDAFAYWLPASIHVGATALLPQINANAALLYYHAEGHSNVMIAGGYSPYEFLNLGLNWTFIGPANRLGFYAEFIPRKYLGLFLGMECASLSSNNRYIPVRNFTESISFGVNVLFGE
ncbi:MAG: hypothetical protein J5508_02145 [Bacteroidales bacterium]|nr:hypothetical protein [Bacteroidales bacterium]